MRRALAAAIAIALPVVLAGGPAAADHDGWPRCRYEDGSGQRRCVWDAVHMGNGSGQS